MNLTPENQELLLAEWLKADEAARSLCSSYDEYSEGRVHGIEEILDMLGINVDQRDQYWRDKR